MVKPPHFKHVCLLVAALVVFAGCGQRTPEERKKHTRDSLAWLVKHQIYTPPFARFHLDVPKEYRVRFYKHVFGTGSGFGCTSWNESGGHTGGEGIYPMWYWNGTKTKTVDLRPDYDGGCQDEYGVEIDVKNTQIEKTQFGGREQLTFYSSDFHRMSGEDPYPAYEHRYYCGWYHPHPPDSVFSCVESDYAPKNRCARELVCYGPGDTADIRIVFKDSLYKDVPVDTITPSGKFTDRPSYVRFVFDGPRDDQFYIQRMASTDGSPAGCPEVRHTLQYHGDSFPVPKGAKSIVVDYRPEYSGRCQKLYSLYVKTNRWSTGQEIHLDGSPQFEDNNFRKVKDTVRMAPLELREYCGVYPDLPGVPVYSCRDVSLHSDLYWGGHQAAYGSNDTAVIRIVFKDSLLRMEDQMPHHGEGQPAQ